MKRKKFRRRNKVIKPGFQYKMAASAVLFLVIYSLVLGAAIFYPLAAEYSATADSDYKSILALSALKVHENLWPALIGISILVFLGTLLFSHRIAGPMYRFEKTVEALTEGNFSIRIKLRKRDEFQEFAGLLNNLAVSMENRQAEENFFRYECRGLLNQLVEKTASEPGNKAEQMLPVIEKLLTKMSTPAGEPTPEPTALSKETQDPFPRQVKVHGEQKV